MYKISLWVNENVISIPILIPFIHVDFHLSHRTNCSVIWKTMLTVYLIFNYYCIEQTYIYIRHHCRHRSKFYKILNSAYNTFRRICYLHFVHLQRSYNIHYS